MPNDPGPRRRDRCRPARLIAVLRISAELGRAYRYPRNSPGRGGDPPALAARGSGARSAWRCPGPVQGRAAENGTARRGYRACCWAGTGWAGTGWAGTGWGPRRRGGTRVSTSRPASTRASNPRTPAPAVASRDVRVALPSARAAWLSACGVSARADGRGAHGRAWRRAGRDHREDAGYVPATTGVLDTGPMAGIGASVGSPAGVGGAAAAAGKGWHCEPPPDASAAGTLPVTPKAAQDSAASATASRTGRRARAGAVRGQEYSAAYS